jgi:hypothetical protein
MPQVLVNDLFGRSFKFLVPTCSVTRTDLQKGLLTQVGGTDGSHLIFSYRDAILEDGVAVTIPRRGALHFIVLSLRDFHERAWPVPEDALFNHPRFSEFEATAAPKSPPAAAGPVVPAPVLAGCRVLA